MTRILFFLAAPFFLTLPASAAAPRAAALRQDDPTYRNELYFVNCDPDNFQPQKVPDDQVSHVIWAFAGVDQYGIVESADLKVAVQNHWPTDSGDDMGNNVYGCVKQLYLLKMGSRGVKVLLSIGGQAVNFATVAANATLRQVFASSATGLVRDWGLDGVDIDWEYPTNTQEAANFVQLLKAVRGALDDYAAKNASGYHFLISFAASADPDRYRIMDLAGMNPLIDTWNIMTYDFAGKWNHETGYQTNLYLDPAPSLATKLSTDRAVKDYVAAGIPAEKLSLGVPMYGRSFEKTKLPVGSSFVGVGPGAPGAAGAANVEGVWPYKTLPRPGARQMYDSVAVASYSYDSSTQEMISYDNPRSVREKAAYLQDQGLGGAFYWEASGDKTGDQSLVAIMADELGALDATQNWLDYPASQYDNLRNGMPGEGTEDEDSS